MEKFIRINVIFAVNPNEVIKLEIVDTNDSLNHAWLNVETTDGRKTQSELGIDPYELMAQIVAARNPNLPSVPQLRYGRKEVTNGPHPKNYPAKNNSGEDPNPTTEKGQRPAAAALG